MIQLVSTAFPGGFSASLIAILALGFFLGMRHPTDADHVVAVSTIIGYGDKFEETKLKLLPPGSFYTEPPGKNHFAETGSDFLTLVF
jgi:hypothetical protein